MIEKIQTEVVLDFNIAKEEDLKNTIDEIKAYTKEYENDKVTLISLEEISTGISDKKKFKIILETKRDSENRGRLYESEEEKLFEFYDEDNEWLNFKNGIELLLFLRLKLILTKLHNFFMIYFTFLNL